LHEGSDEDYTLSVVGGKTRITFRNGLVPPAETALETTEKLYFSYSFRVSEQA
jgi:hypothetical protein